MSRGRRRCRSRPTGRGSCPAATPGCRACRGAPQRAPRTRARSSGRWPGSGGSAPDRGRGRSRSGSPRSRGEAGPRSPRCPPAGWRPRSRRPGHGCGRRTGHREPRPRPRSPRRPGRPGSSANQRSIRRSRDPDRLTRQLLGGEPLRVLTAGVDQGVDQRVAGRGVGLLALDLGQRPGAGDVARFAQVVAGRLAWRAAAGSARRACPARRRCRSASAWSDRPTAPARSGDPPARDVGAGRG